MTPFPVFCQRVSVPHLRLRSVPSYCRRDLIVRPIGVSSALRDSAPPPPPPPPTWPSRNKAKKGNKYNDPIVVDTSEVNLYNKKEAKLWVESLTPAEKKNLSRALQFKLSPESLAEDSPAGQQEKATTAAATAVADEEVSEDERVPTFNELAHLAFHQGLPFIGFGFLDNFIMILAGDYIDHHIGLTLGISTMAAAALGNTISDLFGIGSAWYVESFAARLGAKPPVLTHVQLHMTQSRVAANAGRALGVAFGCIIGMIPLLFMGN